MKWIIIVFLSFFIALALVSGQEIKTFPQNSDSVISHSATVQGAISSGVGCNITIEYPNGIALVNLSTMTFDGKEFNYTLNSTQTSIKGVYDYTVFCTNGVYNNTRSFSYIVNLGGVQPTESRTQALTRTIFIFIGLGILCLVSSFFVRNFPLKVTTLILMVWFFLIGVNFSFIALQDEIVNPSIENFMSFFITLSFRLNQYILYALIIFWMITLFANFLSNKKRKKMERFS